MTTIRTIAASFVATLALGVTAFTVVLPSAAHAAPAADTQAFAVEPGEGPSKVVRYGDLDLASEQDRATLTRRIHRAAHAVCSNAGGTGDILHVRMAHDACFTVALNSGLTRMAALLSPRQEG